MTIRRPALTSIVAMLLAGSLTHARQGQSAAPAALRIAGRVVAAESTRPLAALIEAVPVLGGVPVRVRAGADGRFVLTGLAPNEYRVTAQFDGYVPLEFGQTRPPAPGRPIDLRATATFDAANFTLPRASAVEGVLVDEFGDPAPGVDVQIARVEYVAGKRRLLPVSTPRRTRPTDDRGQFRIFGLPPGDYYVMALSGPFTADNNRAGFAPTFYPGTTAAVDAQPVRVDIGRDASGITFALAPAASATMSGVAVDEAGQPLRSTGVMLAQINGGDVRLIVPARASTAADGTFTFTNVPFGTYVLQATAAAGFGSLTVAVDRPDVSGLTIPVRRRATMRGRLVFEGDAAPAAGTRVRVTARPVDFVNGPLGGGPPQSRVNADWSFEVTGLAGLGVVSADPAPPWVLQRVTWNGRDVTDEPIDFRTGAIDGIEIVMSTRLASVTGTATDRGTPVVDYAVVVFADDRSLWTFPSRFIAMARSNQQGRFTIAGLPPGSYVAVAVREILSFEWQDPDVLETLRAHGTRLTLADGDRSTLTLPIAAR